MIHHIVDFWGAAKLEKLLGVLLFERVWKACRLTVEHSWVESELLMWLCSSVTDNSHLGDDASILRRKRRKLRILDIRIKYLPTSLVVNPGKLLQREKFLVEPALKSIHPRDRYNIQCSAAHHHYTKTNMSSLWSNERGRQRVFWGAKKVCKMNFSV